MIRGSTPQIRLCLRSPIKVRRVARYIKALFVSIHRYIELQIHSDCSDSSDSSDLFGEKQKISSEESTKTSEESTETSEESNHKSEELSRSSLEIQKSSRHGIALTQRTHRSCVRYRTTRRVTAVGTHDLCVRCIKGYSVRCVKCYNVVVLTGTDAPIVRPSITLLPSR